MFGRCRVPSAWRRRTDVVSAQEDEEGLDFEEGEELGSVNTAARGGGRDDVRRLSRE